MLQPPVDAQPHERDVALRLEVNVRGALLERVAEQMIERLHNRRRRGVELFDLGGEIFLVAQLEGRQPPRGQLLLGGLQARLEIVEALVDRLDVRPRRDDPLNRPQTGHALDVVDRKRRERVVHRDGELLIVFRDRDEAMFARERARQRARDDVEIEFEGVDADESQTRKGGQRFRDLDLGRDPELHDRLHHRHRVGAGISPHALGLIAGDRLAEDEGSAFRGGMGIYQFVSYHPPMRTSRTAMIVALGSVRLIGTSRQCAGDDRASLASPGRADHRRIIPR